MNPGALAPDSPPLAAEGGAARAVGTTVKPLGVWNPATPSPTFDLSAVTCTLGRERIPPRIHEHRECLFNPTTSLL